MGIQQYAGFALIALGVAWFAWSNREVVLGWFARPDEPEVEPPEDPGEHEICDVLDLADYWATRDPKVSQQLFATARAVVDRLEADALKEGTK